MDFEIRRDHSPYGGKRLVRERDTYLDLVNEGVSSLDACRIVGIERHAGERANLRRQCR
jgi:IS30 family transposase